MKTKALIISYEKIHDLLKVFSEKNTVLVGGCFDLIHYGHLQFLDKAKEAGDYLVVALESDEFIKKTKRKDPIHTQGERAEILASLNMVDVVIVLPFFKDSSQYFDLVRTIRPKIIAITEGDVQTDNKKKQAEGIGAEIRIVTPLITKYSTRKIINSID